MQVGVISRAAREIPNEVGVINRAARWLDISLFLIRTDKYKQEITQQRHIY